MVSNKNEQMRKDVMDVMNDDVISSFLDDIINNDSTRDFDGVLTPEKTNNSVVIMLDGKRIVEVPYDNITENKSDMVNEVCRKIQLEKNMFKFIWYCLDVLLDMININYGYVLNLKRDDNSLEFKLKKDGAVHLIKLIPDEYNARVIFDDKDTDILIPDLTGDYFDYNICYMNHDDVSYDENCIDQLAMNYLQ